MTFADGAGVGRATAVTELRGPTRAGLREHWWRSADYTGQRVALGPVATPEISYANRSGEYVQAALEGWYYLVVKLGPMWTEGSAVPDEQPTFEIALTVGGSAGEGPRYGEVSVPSSAPASTSSTWTPSSASPVSGFAFTSGCSSFPWWVLGVTGGVLLLGAVVVLALRFGRRRT